MEDTKPKKEQELTFIVKPTLDCNLDCEYCYRGKDPYQGMQMDRITLRNVIGKFLTYVGPERGIHFVWHGGEPLLMGVEFFNDIIEIQSGFSGYQIYNSVQTNMTLLTTDFLDFFAKHHFGIGFSLDGPKELHDSQRRHGNGSGTFDEVMSGIDLCKRADIPNRGGLCSKSRKIA